MVVANPDTCGPDATEWKGEPFENLVVGSSISLQVDTGDEWTIEGQPPVQNWHGPGDLSAAKFQYDKKSNKMCIVWTDKCKNMGCFYKLNTARNISRLELKIGSSADVAIQNGNLGRLEADLSSSASFTIMPSVTVGSGTVKCGSSASVSDVPDTVSTSGCN